MSSPSTATLPLGTENDIDDLSEQQLREFYENEEMDRFLTIFSTVRRSQESRRVLCPS